MSDKAFFDQFYYAMVWPVHVWKEDATQEQTMCADCQAAVVRLTGAEAEGRRPLCTMCYDERDRIHCAAAQKGFKLGL